MKRLVLLCVICAAAGWAAGPAAGQSPINRCMDKWREGRAVHIELQNQAIEELNGKNYKAACKTMRELADLSESIRRYLQLHCKNNEAMKRGLARTDDIAVRADEICAKAK
jgi:hypothetical protein